MTEFKIMEETHIYEPTEEDERDFWSGKGHLTVFVIQNHKGIFEIEKEEHSGCAGGAQEMVGFDYLITDMLYLKDVLKEGWSYIIHGLTVTYYRGDGWSTDDDMEYEYRYVQRHLNIPRFLKHKISIIWWRFIGWRINQWLTTTATSHTKKSAGPMVTTSTPLLKLKKLVSSVIRFGR